MKRAIQWTALGLLALIATASSGCGVGTTRQDNMRQFHRTAEYDARMMVDDVRVFWQIDRPFRGSRIPIE